MMAWVARYRNGLNFTERGFGVRAAWVAPIGDHAISQLQPGEIDWETVFVKRASRWFHTGGIFAALSETTPLVRGEADGGGQGSGAIVSYDLNYRESLWKRHRRPGSAREVNRELASLCGCE